MGESPSLCQFTNGMPGSASRIKEESVKGSVIGEDGVNAGATACRRFPGDEGDVEHPASPKVRGKSH